MVDTRVRLQRGRGESQVAPAGGAASRYQITTPAAVAAVRGTLFRVAAEETSGATRAEVIEGRVDVEGDGVKRLVVAGFGVVAEVGKPPSEPRKLLPPPDLGGLPSRVKRLPLTFQWPKIEAARAHRVQIFADRTFRRLLLEQHVQRPRVVWADLPDGRYVLRVRGIDGIGLEGLNADHPFTLETGPRPPVPLKPRDGETLRTLRPEFSWAAPTGVTGVRLQVARDLGFNDVVVEVTRDAAASVDLEKRLPPGLYYWRLASRRADGDAGPFGAPREFRLQAVPNQPHLRLSTVEERKVQILWGTTSYARHYRCQFARSVRFTEIIEERLVKEPGCRTDRLAPGSYYGRAQGISAEGVAGPFSNVVPFEVTRPNYLSFVLFALLLLLLILL